MSSLAAYDAFETRLRSAWSETPIAFENEGYEPDGTPHAFVYVEIIGENFRQESTGAPRANLWIERGITLLHVLVPKGTGSREARGYADGLMNLFREQSINGVQIIEMSSGDGEVPEFYPNYFAIRATIIWQRNDFTNLTP